MPDKMTQISKIYKICDEALWREAEKTGLFNGAGIDIKDGYIHFSTASQIASTLALHFTSQTGLLLIEVNTSDLDIVYEEARGGQLFPHLYDALSIKHVTRTWPLELDTQNIHILPSL